MKETREAPLLETADFPLEEEPPSYDDSMELEGEELGSWSLEERLGAGGIGEVYRARHIHLGLTAALKLPHISLAEDPIYIERFRREALAMMRCKHPNIIEAREFAVDPTYGPYLVMELLEGYDMEVLLESEAGAPLQWGWIKGLLLPLCDALQVVHDQELVHRDIKPSNIFLVPQPSGLPQLKLLDFGTAKIRFLHSGDSALTTTGVIVGTPCYLAPEQVSASAQVKAQADIYAVGVIAYRMLTGQLPLSGDSLFQQLLMVTQAVPQPLGERRPEFAGSLLEELLQRCLSKAPEARPATASQLKKELEQAFAQVDRKAKPPEPEPPVVRKLSLSYAFAMPTPEEAHFELSAEGLQPKEAEEAAPAPRRRTTPVEAPPPPPSFSALSQFEPTPSSPGLGLGMLLVAVVLAAGVGAFGVKYFDSPRQLPTRQPPRKAPVAGQKGSFFDQLKLRLPPARERVQRKAPRLPTARPPQPRARRRPRRRRRSSPSSRRRSPSRRTRPRIGFVLERKARRAYRKRRWAEALKFYEAHVTLHPKRRFHPRIKRAMKACRCALGKPLSWESCDAGDFPPGVRPPTRR